MSTITPHILLRAYAAGIFPMAENAEDAALYWVEPEERGIIPLDGLHISHSLRKSVRRQHFEVKIDADFPAVIAACAAKAPHRSSTWINGRIRSLYTQLHRMGACHSVECWQEGKLAGGLYGVRIGAVFFGESMFSKAPDASKVALVHLVARLNAGGFRLLDAQFLNAHLAKLGAVTVAQAEYRQMLEPALDAEADFFAFKGDNDAELVLKLAGGIEPKAPHPPTSLTRGRPQPSPRKRGEGK
ncbi:MAG: leucyl/phenylalanyl-tRNA--protein transferase [Aestuariivirga sp.]